MSAEELVTKKFGSGWDQGILKEIGLADYGSADLLAEALEDWVVSEGTVWAEPPSRVERILLVVLHPASIGSILIGDRWHVRLSRVAWAAITLLPLVAVDFVALNLGVSVAGFHGLIQNLFEATKKLTPDEARVARRLKARKEKLGDCSRRDLRKGLGRKDKQALDGLLDKMIGSGVLVERSDGLHISF